jgi:flap endonuclease-1
MGVDIKDLVYSQKTSLFSLAGKIIGIDGDNMGYQFLAGIRKDGEPLRDLEGNITSHLYGAFYRLQKFLVNNVKIVVAFDTKPPEFKIKTINQRIELRKRIGLEKFTKEMKDELIELLSAMGIPTFYSKSEAEAQICMLNRIGKINGILSQDYDSLLFGGKHIYRNYIDGKELDYINLDLNLKKLNISREQLIVLGMLIGTDYNDGIKNIGPKKAYQLVKEKSIEYLLNIIEKENYVDAKAIFEYFLNPPYEDIEITFQKPDKDKIVEILVEKHNFSKDKVLSALSEKSNTLFDL